MKNRGSEIRYGQNLYFRWQGYAVVATEISGYCARIQYGKNGKWTELELTQLLELNGGIAHWTESQSTSQKERHWAGEPRRNAKWIRKDSIFVLEMDVFTEALKDAKRPRPSKKPDY